MKSLEKLFALNGKTNVGSFVLPNGARTVIYFGDLDEPPPEDTSPSATLKNLLAGAVDSYKAPMLEVRGNTVFPLPPNVAELLDFSQALAALKSGYPLARTDWQEKKYYVRAIVVVDRNNPKVAAGVNLVKIDFSGKALGENAVVAWSPTASDVMSDDWEILTETYLEAEAKRLRSQRPPPTETL